MFKEVMKAERLVERFLCDEIHYALLARPIKLRIINDGTLASSLLSS